MSTYLIMLRAYNGSFITERIQAYSNSEAKEIALSKHPNATVV